MEKTIAIPRVTSNPKFKTEPSVTWENWHFQLSLLHECEREKKIRPQNRGEPERISFEKRIIQV